MFVFKKSYGCLCPDYTLSGNLLFLLTIVLAKTWQLLRKLVFQSVYLNTSAFESL